MKNFSDTGITSTASASIGSAIYTTLVQDITEESRVDTIRNLDLARDTDFLANDSKYIEFKTIRLSDYVECKTNNVLRIDSIDQQFSNLEGEPSEYLNILEKLPTENQFLDDSDPNKFIAKMGAECLIELLSRIDLDELSYELRHKANTETSKQRKTESLKRLQVVESLREANQNKENKPKSLRTRSGHL